MSRTLLTGATVRVERPRPLSYAECHQLMLDRRISDDTDVDWNDDNQLELTSAPPCAWVAQVEALALAGAL